MEKGCAQVYTGDGKGKTTAALGLLLRAVGAGCRVYFAQFMKDGASAEIGLLRARFPEVTVAIHGSGRFVCGKPDPEEVRRAREGLAALRVALQSGRYDVIVADEANTAAAAGLFSAAELTALMALRPPTVELVLTGRQAHPEVLAQADLVTEMVCRKHYHKIGLCARKGIEF